MAGPLGRRDHQNGGQDGDEDQVRDHAEHQPAQAPSRLPASRLIATAQCAQRDGGQPYGQGGEHHDQAHRLVQDDR
ncbi:hypothetical protein [Nonomuraea sp. NPDC046570]|uniref:hypothetical protein n=1 Tax=Nonomuraea sp. NPDC046570 TaxID=3155255 RepID=UPI0033C5E2F0